MPTLTANVGDQGPLCLQHKQYGAATASVSTSVDITGIAIGAQVEFLLGADATVVIDDAAISTGIGAASGDSDFVATNLGATPNAPNEEICERTGVKLYPGEAQMSYPGRLVRPKSVDPEPYRESLKYRSVKSSPRTKNAEIDDVFYSSIAPEDL